MRVYIFLQQMSDLLSNLGKVHPHSEPVFPSAKSATQTYHVACLESTRDIICSAADSKPGT